MRMSMELSYHDEKSMVETAASWRFASYSENRDPEYIEIVEQGRLDPNNIQQSDDIEIVDR